MPETTTIAYMLLGVPAFGMVVYWCVTLYHIVRTVRVLPTARSGIAMADQRPVDGNVVVVVPAHNEADVIEGLVESLREQDHPDLRVVLALDRCTDRTVEVARRAVGQDRRFAIIEIDHCPEDWAGKVHAIWEGLQRSGWFEDSDYLLFADADTIFDPACVRATLALMRERDLDMLSLLSTLTNDRWYELVAQTAAGWELLQQYPLERANREHGRRAFANGQFMAFRREAYLAVGGHPSVRDALLEDLALARLVEDEKLRTGVLLADGMLRCRMYRSYHDFRRGWKRIFTEAAKRRPKRLYRGAARNWGIMIVMTACSILGMALAPFVAGPAVVPAIVGGLSAAGFLAMLVVIVSMYHLGRIPLWAAPAFIAGAAIVGSIMYEAARDLDRGRPTTWGGRTYAREKR